MARGTFAEEREFTDARHYGIDMVYDDKHRPRVPLLSEVDRKAPIARESLFRLAEKRMRIRVGTGRA